MHDLSRLGQISLARRVVLSEGAELDDKLADRWRDRPWIMQSWRRSLAQGRKPGESLAFDAVSKQAHARTVEAHTELLAAAREELKRLGALLVPTRYFVILTDPSGAVVATAGAVDHSVPQIHAVARVGINLSEHNIGITAVSAALAVKASVWLHRGEHFFRQTSAYSCAGAPLFGPQGECVGMLDVTGVDVPERPELRHLVSQRARRIEEALTLARPHRLRLYLDWLDLGNLGGVKSDSGLVCLDADGRVVSTNQAAREILPELQSMHRVAFHATDLFPVAWQSLFDLARQNEPRTVPLWSGLRVRISTRTAGHQAGLGIKTPSLKMLEIEMIHQAVRDAGGRVDVAAKALGLSRATVYRRLATYQTGSRGKPK